MTNAYPKVFRNENKFQDDIWGEINLNYLECEVVDTPEFQRLFRTSQLGFVDFVYHSANHTRGTHSIGSCRAAELLMSHLTENTARGRPADQRYANVDISPAERVLIRLGALLHDISHVPLSHDLERKSHKVFFKPMDRTGPRSQLNLGSCYGFYPKHDDYELNPLLYILLCDVQRSVLARVLRHYSKAFHDLLCTAKTNSDYQHLNIFVDLLNEAKTTGWKPEEELLPSLLFHLLVWEDPEKDGEKHERLVAVNFGNGAERDGVVTETWGLGPRPLRQKLHRAWYHPFRHDIIGNTLSADLIDYLKRDPKGMGSDRRIDLHLLNYYVLVSHRADSPEGSEDSKNHTGSYRCAIDLHDRKRGTPRVNLIDDIFRLLDLRHEIHQKAVLHRVVQASNAMLSRALFLLGDNMPSLMDIVEPGMPSHALKGEDALFALLLQRCNDVSHDAKSENDSKARAAEAKRIILKLADRRVFRPLVIIPGDRAARHFQITRPNWSNIAIREYCLRTLATITNSERYKPFLLFASNCVERYLTGFLETDEALDKYVCAVAAHDSDPALVVAALSSAPSRVLIWAPPYKQLYKDPAIVVSLAQNRTARIDSLAVLEDQRDLDESVLERVQKGIADADSKYAALWAIYVFIGDGLFYTGALKKLTKLGKSTPSLEDHVNQLKHSQLFMVAALDAICRDWSEACESESSPEDLQRRLDEKLDATTFKDLLQMWMAIYKLGKHRRNPIPRLSAVNVAHYAHGDPLTTPHDHKCRDIRHKFDTTAANTWALARTEKTGVNSELIELLESAGVKDPNILSELEFELISDLYVASRDKCRKLREQVKAGNQITMDDLRFLWGYGFPLLAPSTLSTHVARDFPRSEREIRKWLDGEARVLEPHVRLDLTRGAARIVAFMQSVPEPERLTVFRDLEERFLNESELIWNNAKAGRVVRWLERKWRKQGLLALPLKTNIDNLPNGKS